MRQHHGTYVTCFLRKLLRLLAHLSLSRDKKKIVIQKEEKPIVIIKLFCHLSKNKIIPDSNMICTFVIFCKKSNGSAKAIIVPRGYCNTKKCDVKRYAPTLNHVSVAVRKNWPIWNSNEKPAYLHAKRLKQIFHIVLLQKQLNDHILYKLLALAYGLKDSCQLWHLTSHTALLKCFGILHIQLDASLNFCCT